VPKTTHFFALTVACYCLPASADEMKADGQWRGFVNAGASVASGNTKSTSVNVGAEATRITEINKLHSYLTALYGTQEDSNGVSGETANLVRGGGKYDYNLDEKTFTFTAVDLERDRLQKLKLRSVFGLGFGYHAVKTTELSFDVFTGLTYNREQFFDRTRDSAELVVGEESSHKVSETTSFKQRLALYPNLTESGQYRAQLDGSLTTAINSRVGLQLTVSDRYQSNPEPGIKNNDVLFLTNVNYKFGPK
jgi:putative salt-induced outer membrane protein